MPCENCGVQFSVFRRKRTCNNCRRFYCSDCLTNLKRNSQIVCERCAVFAKRPLLRSDLLQLKPKDLIFFLQSKHISTKGCVEKDELIRLVLHHVDQSDAGGSEQQQQRNGPTESPGNSFDNLRQTCQNFFFNISDNISDSLSSFDSKNSKPEKQDNNNVNDSNSNNSNDIGNMPTGRRRSSNNTNTHSSTTPTVRPHIFDQPRVSRREIPTYASSLNSSGTTNAPNPPPPQPASSTTTATTIIINERAPDCQQPTTSSRGTTSSSSQSSSLASPIVSISSMASQTQVTGLEEAPSASNLNVPTKQSDCECSDEELFANYSLTAATTATMIRTMTSTPPIESPNLEPQQTTAEATTQNAQGTKVSSPKTNAMTGDEVSHSSFEELGAVGCNAEDSGGSSNTEAWQLLEPTDNAESIDAADDTAATSNEMGNKCDPTGGTLQRKKLLRRRSDRQRSSVSEELQSPISSSVINAMTASENSTKLESVTERTATGLSSTSRNDSVELPPASRRPSGTCRRCGKSNIRRYIEKLRQHLESAQMSEADIKREMNDFLAYLDEQTRSVDYSETETSASSNGLASGNAQIVLSPTTNNRPPFFIDFVDDNDGINGADDSASSTEQNARFINIRNIDKIEKLESLSVKQLKEVLMLHRVDFKGCCEKQELFERVERLWKEIKTSPAVESLGTDELCKICMDAPIDCVLLECGHMATCTKCGKVLSECPICRQYIVRVVHTFRA